MTKWTTSDIPTQRGRTAIVTGTGGIGYQVALALARAGAAVTLAGRDAVKGDAAVRSIRERIAGAEVAFGKVDLANLRSVEAFARDFTGTHHLLDVLVNNAGVMTPPQREVTADGFERQFGTNHLGHFALTGHLLPLLRRTAGARVVGLSSIAARQGTIDFDDLQSARRYRPMVAYSQSKLACLLFALELQRRSEAAGWGIRSIAAHPGIARTDLLVNGAGPWSAAGLVRRAAWFLFQPAEQGALSALFAATSPSAQGGAYYGPDRLAEMRGHPTAAAIPAQAQDRAVAERLWQESEALAGVTFADGVAIAPMRIGAVA